MFYTLVFIGFINYGLEDRRPTEIVIPNLSQEVCNTQLNNLKHTEYLRDLYVECVKQNN